MHLTSFRIERLLSFDQFQLELTPGLNVIVGPNGAGKSNLLRLVELVRRARLPTQAEGRLAHGRPFYFRACLLTTIGCVAGILPTMWTLIVPVLLVVLVIASAKQVATSTSNETTLS